MAYPLGAGDLHESPTKYFFLNERRPVAGSSGKRPGAGGYSPLGLDQGLHGGIHLDPAVHGDNRVGLSSWVPVRAALPGYVVAARVVDSSLCADKPQLVAAVGNQPLGFVLIRHELTEVTESPERKSWPLYSLYMHLAAPNRDRPDKEFNGARWLEKFIRMQHGGVVCLDAEHETDVGRVFWAKQEFSKEDTVPVPVYDKAELLARKADGRMVGYGKPAPKAIAEAVAALRRGEVVTFDRPVLTVDTGEVIGFIEPSAHPRWLHWEIFSPPNQGLAALCDKAKALGIDLGLPLHEPLEDNFLSMPSRLFPGSADEIGPFFKDKTDPELNPVIIRASYGDALAEVFDRGKDFCDKSVPGSAFRYPLTLKLANPYHFRPDDAAARKVAVTFQRNGHAVGGTIDAELKASGESLLVELDVPAEADTAILASSYFKLRLTPRRPPPPPNETMDARKERLKREQEAWSSALTDVRKAMWTSVTGRRWRNIVLRHLNEWNAANLGKYIDSRLAAGYGPFSPGGPSPDIAELKKQLAFLGWWAAPKDNKDTPSEVQATGDGARPPSLFGADGTFLPADGHIEDMHPVTALWLLDIVLAARGLAVQSSWPDDTLIKDDVANDPPFLGVIGPGGPPRLGEPVALAAIQHGYFSSRECDQKGVVFMAHPEKQDPHILAMSSYLEGAAVVRENFPFWGNTTVKALGRAPGKVDEELNFKHQEGTTVENLRPEPAGEYFSLLPAMTSKGNEWVGTILIKKNCPYVLDGYLAFTCWKVPAGEKPDFSVPGEPGTCLLPVAAKRNNPKEEVRDGLILNGDFIVGAAALKQAKGKKGKEPPTSATLDRGSPKTAKVSKDYVLQDFIGTPERRVAEAELAEFRLALPLVQRLQMLRDACKGERTKFDIVALRERGYDLTMESDSARELLERAKGLPPDELFTIELLDEGRQVGLAYKPNPATGGMLQFSVDPTAAVQELATKMSSESGEQIFARPTFVAPNGGHHILESWIRHSDEVSEGDVVSASEQDLKVKVKNDCLTWKTDTMLPPGHAFGLGPLQVSFGRESVLTQVELLGTAKAWSKATVKIICTDPSGKEIRAGKPKRGLVSATWPIERRNGTKDHPTWTLNWWGKTLLFRAEATHCKGTTPPPVKDSFTLQPKLESLKVEPQGTEVLFTGHAHALPTSAGLAILCERQTETGWERMAAVPDRIHFARSFSRRGHVSSTLGSPSEDMSFGAQVPAEVFEPGAYRFIWYVAEFSDYVESNLSQTTHALSVPQLNNLVISALTTESFNGEELRSGKKTPVAIPHAGAPHVR